MSEVGRFGVFLPSYIWEGDGAERARGIKAFARTVEELGLRLALHHRPPARGKRFYSVSFLEPLTALAVAAGVTERVRLGTSILIMPLRNPVILAKELATLQFLSENRMILGAGVGWNDAEYEAVGVHKSERGKRTDEMLDIMMPLLEGETVTLPRPLLLGRRRLHRAAVVAAAGDLDRRRLAARRPEVARPAASSSSRSRRASCDRTAGSRGRPARRTTSPATGPSSRRTTASTARTRPRCFVAHENFLHLVLTNDPAKAREEQHRAFLKVMSAERGPAVPRVGLPVRDAGRDRRLAPGAGRRRRRVLRPPHDDARPGAAPGLGRRDHPERRRSRRRPGPVRRPTGGRVARDPAGRAARQAAQAAPLAGHARRRVRRGRASTPTTCCWSSSRTRSRRPSRRRADRSGSGLGVTAPYKRRRRRRWSTRSRPTPRTIGAVNNVVRTDDGRLVGFNTRRAGLPGGRRAGDGPAARRARRRRRRAPAARRTRSSSPAWSAGARRVTVGNRTVDAARRSPTRFARRRRGSRRGRARRRRRSSTALAIGRPRRQRDDGRHDRSRA